MSIIYHFNLSLLLTLSFLTAFIHSRFESIDALIEAVNEFNGGIVCVTHDQRLIDECDCELWVVQDRDAEKWSKGFDDYKDSILTKLEEQAAKEEKMRNERLEAAAKEREEKLARFKEKMKK